VQQIYQQNIVGESNELTCTSVYQEEPIQVQSSIIHRVEGTNMIVFSLPEVGKIAGIDTYREVK
jgi:hypothetical protein